MNIRMKPFLKYTMTPQVLPRIQTLFFSGFSYVAFFMAQIYRAVRLLPDGHPYLNPANMGRFGLRQVIAEAGNNLVFRKENIDQILVFAIMVLGVVIIGMQLFMLLVSGFVNVAHAGLYGSSNPLDFFSYFSTPDATNDVAFVLLDRVFGIPGIGGPGTSFFADANGGYTCVVEVLPCFDLGQSTRVLTPERMVATDYNHTAFTLIPFPWPYHDALRGMLQFYSVGLLVIGVLIFVYFIFALAAETMQTGSPFGRRFNQIWAPFRIVVAMGLLVPIVYGLNPAQWILMFAARWGSSFATNGWIIYSNAIAGEETPLGDTDTLVAWPADPPVNTLMDFGSELAVCYEAYNRIIHARQTRPLIDIDAWLINPDDVGLAPLPFATTTFNEAVRYFGTSSIHVRFGELRNDTHQSWDGRVAPFCGELSLDLPYVAPDMTVGVGTGPPANATEPGSIMVEDRWYTLMKDIWCSASARCPQTGTWGGGGVNFRDIFGIPMADRHIVFHDRNAPLALAPTPQEMTALREMYELYIQTTVSLGVLYQRDSVEWQERLTQLGWGGAAIWYNKIAQLNGGLVSAVYAMPTIKKYPYVMEQMRKERAASDNAVSGETTFTPSRGTGSPMDLNDIATNQILEALDETRNLWSANYSSMKRESNFMIDAINAIFGTQGLFDITRNENMDIHPLAQLASIGRTLVESAIRNLGYSVAAGLSGGIANIVQLGPLGSFAGTAGSFLFQVAMIGLSVGFVLFYIIPFLPFIYYFFAVGTWIKAIFEAMVGVPLWALAHIRIDGDGLPGAAAMGGYYLIFEILLRPILIVFGFIASITIFAAQVRILHEIWWLVVSNVNGFSEAASGGAAADQTGSIDYLRSAVDELFYTVIYAIVCYMMAMGSFKLIDQIPNHLLRWMGASVSTFGDQSDDPAQNLVRNSFIGTNMVAGPLRQAAGGISGAGQAGTGAVGELFGRARR